MTATIQVRRDTSANWTAANPTLNDGEIGFETDTGNFKIGSGSAWNSTLYAEPTIPVRASVGTDLDAPLYENTGRYHFVNGSALINAPSAPANIVAADGGAVLMVMRYPTGVIVQTLTTEADGSQPLKSWQRVYDGSWRAWEPLGNWGVSATEGVDVNARDIEVKRNLDVEGLPTNSVAPTWAQFAADLLLRGNAFGNQSVFAIQHFTANGSFADLSDQGANLTWTVTDYNTASVSITPSNGTWWGMVVGFGGTPKVLLGVASRDFTAASGAAFVCNGSAAMQNLFLFAIRAT